MEGEDMITCNDRVLAGVWKPVINGKIQLSAQDDDNINNNNIILPHHAVLEPNSGDPPGIDQMPSAPVPVAGCTDQFHKPRISGDFEKGKWQTINMPTADEEYKRYRRLLTTRISARKARERHKKYVEELERNVNELQLKNTELERTVFTLSKENYVLRQLLGM